MYSRIVDSEEYTFGVSGKLIMNVLVMYDRQTGTLWSQLLGLAVEGELKGKELEFLPSWQTTWADWKARHPETLALVKGYSGNFDPYNSYYASGQAGVIGRSNFALEDDLYTKEFVIGVEVDGEAVAYPFSVLNQHPVIHDRIGETDVLVVFSAEGGAGAVFDRSLDGETLTFTVQNGLQLVDDQTGSTWDGLSGIALEGPLAGQSLERVKSTTIFWFGWADFYPETEIFTPDQD